ncbi:MAG: precorrin-2 C(20)-methyltransferase [Leptolyngbyaceae bacterium]|nr:precorrin-2 C(20)-methyltransferase [Leptolyngbyaceae bacterium]
MQIGTLYGIGAGPGDPELITLKGWRLLQRVPVVAFPAGIQGKPGIAQQIGAEWFRPEQIQLDLVFPYVQEMQVLTQAWQVAAEQVWQHLIQGQDVAFLSEGDVSFYSTFTYLAQTLQQVHPEAIVQVIPGICSPLAAAAVLGIPLTIRAQRLVVLPALYNPEELEAILAWADVVVLMKVSSVYQQVWAILEHHHLLDRSYVVERATLPEQKIYANLSDYPSLTLPYFSLLVVQVTDES